MSFFCTVRNVLFKMERRNREISLDEVEIDEPALVHVETGGGIQMFSQLSSPESRVAVSIVLRGVFCLMFR